MIAAPPPIPDWQILVVLVPVFFGIGSLTFALTSLIGGWHKLAQLYLREETTFSIGDGCSVERYRGVSLKMGPKYFPANYGNCATVTLSDDGIGLSVMLLFRPFHPPLLIPWTAIENCQLGKELGLFDRAVIQVQGVANPIRVFGRAGRAIARYWSAARSTASVANATHE